MPLRLILAALLAVAALATSNLTGEAAEQFPSRQITLVVPLTPGTTIDILARLYADKLGKLLGQQIVVMNRPGAGGIVGAESVATARRIAANMTKLPERPVTMTYTQIAKPDCQRG